MATITASDIILAGGLNIYYYHAIQQQSPLSVRPALAHTFPDATEGAINSAYDFAAAARAAGRKLNAANRKWALADSAIPSLSSLQDMTTLEMCFEARIDMRFTSGSDENAETQYYTIVVTSDHSMTPDEVYQAGVASLQEAFGGTNDRYSKQTIDIQGGDIVYVANAC